MRLWRFNNPHRAAYGNLRDSARKRKINFAITFDEFVELVKHTCYMDQKGRERYCYHIDRIDVTRGYEWGNLQIITCSENVIKGNQERRAAYVAAKIQSYTPAPADDPEWCDDSDATVSDGIDDNCPF